MYYCINIGYYLKLPHILPKMPHSSLLGWAITYQYWASRPRGRVTKAIVIKSYSETKRSKRAAGAARRHWW
jgi:hypothetical protein